MSLEPSTSSVSPEAAEHALSWPAVSWIWTRHLTSLLFPISTLAFLWTGPHPWYVAPLFMLPSVFLLDIDSNATVERRQPVASTPGWPFDGLVYFLAGLQLLIVFELARMYAIQGFFSVDTAMVLLVVGGSSGFSIINAHELIHRNNLFERTLGRLVLASVLQEHFYTEHLRGHHVKVGLPDDPATARFGESYEAFYRRTVPAQMRSAWRIEAKRLGDPNMPFFDVRTLGNRVLHGIVVGWGIGFAIWFQFGPASFAVFLVQAFMASRLLEVVNYFEHWGLRRTARRIRPSDSWDTHSWFTYYGLTGLSRHADHHREPARPFQQLQVFEEAPVLPTGYIGLIFMMTGRNHEFQQQAVRELMQRELGPFSPETEPEEAERAHETARKILAHTKPPHAGLFGPNAEGERGLRVVLPRIAILLGVVLVLTVGVQFENPGALSFVGRFALDAWILAAFYTMIRVYRRLSDTKSSEGLRWSAAMGMLFTIGTITTNVIGF
ncbi:MAG: alkane 1-monooxygenase [Myxococcales bacterium]|nr:alkane 1-monooxygenase [Myxococcales bacterium]